MSAWCRRCALGEPHRFAHWHVRCPVCRRWRVFRGPSCGDCYRLARSIISL